MMPSPEQSKERLRLAELYCGIGGLTQALSRRSKAVVAVDVSRLALGVVAHNRDGTEPKLLARAIESLALEEMRSWRADLWWMSPPCQPYTRRGLRRELADPRARSFVSLMRRLAELRPRYVALENVSGFEGSSAHVYLREVLDSVGYRVWERLLCPSELGVPNRRRRFYLVAARGRLAPFRPGEGPRRRLADLLDLEPSPDLWVGGELERRYAGALDIVHSDDPAAVTACFTSAYGRSPVRSGSYLATPSGLRRFSPYEILRLLGFPETFSLPADLPLAKAWRLVGNSLSLDAVRAVMTTVPELALESG